MGQTKSKNKPFKESTENSIKDYHAKAVRDNEKRIKDKKEKMEKVNDEFIAAIHKCIELSVTSDDQTGNIYKLPIDKNIIPYRDSDVISSYIYQYDKYIQMKKYLKDTLGISIKKIPRADKYTDKQTYICYDRLNNWITCSL